MECIRVIGVCVMFVISTSAQTVSSPIYLISVPSALLPGVPTSLSFTVFSDDWVTVIAEIVSGNTSVARTTGTFRKGLTSLQTLPPILDNASGAPRQYTLVVNGYIDSQLVFTNRTVLQLSTLSFSTFIQTDKSHYKPGQAVKIRAVSVYQDGKPHKGPADIRIKDPKQNLVRQWLSVDSFLGVVSRELQLSENPPLGTWTIVVSVNDVVSERRFAVEHYVPPQFEVLVKAPSVIYHEDNLNGTVDARRMYGRPVHGVLTVTVEFVHPRKHLSVNKIKKINGSADFVFSKHDLYEESLKSMKHGDELIVNVTASVRETLTGLTYNRTVVVIMVDEKYHLEFCNHPSMLKPSLNFSVQLMVSLYDRRPLTPRDRVENVTVAVTQSRTVPVEDEPRPGSLQALAHEGGSGVTGDAPLILSLPVPQDGVIHLHFQLLDQVSALSIQAHFMDSVETLDLQRDYSSPSRSYIQIGRFSSPAQVGIPLQLFAESNYPLSELHYVVTSGGRMVAAGTATSGSFSLTPETSWAPMAHLVVYSVRSDGEIVNDATRFPVRPAPRNNVSLSWGRTKVKPEEDVSLTVTVTEPGALVGIRVVDKATECLQPGKKHLHPIALGELAEEDMDMNDVPFEMSGDPFSVFTACKLMVLTDADLPATEQFGEPDDSVERIERWLAMDREPRMCRNSPETWLWLEANMSQSTTTSLHLKVPDRITSWFASAFVVSDNLGLGLTSAPVKLSVSQDFFLSLALPSFVIRGEQLVLEVQLFNNREQDLRALVFVASSELFDFTFAGDESSPSSEARAVSVGSRDSATLLFPIRLKALGVASVTAHAISALDSDEVTRTVLVKPEGVEKSFTKSLFLEMDPSGQNHIREILFTFPPEVVPGSPRAEVAAVGNILGPSLAGLESLIKMPYGCGEQNMIHFAPNIYVLQYLTTTSQVEDALYSRAVSFMVQGYQQELSYQRADGSFSAFGDSDSSGSTWLSAFVLRSFLQARPFISIDAGVISQTSAWLVAQQGDDGAFGEPGRVIHTELQGGLDGPVSLTAYTLMALLESHIYKDSSIVSKGLDFLESKVADGISSNYSLCLVTYTLSLAQRSSANTALAGLLNRADVNDGVASWSSPDGGLSPSWQPRSADIEMAGYALLSLYAQANVAEGLALMKWLSQQRNHLGGYGTTQDTIVALQALSQYATFSGSEAIELNITVMEMGSHTVATFHINSTNSLLRQSKEIETEDDIHLNVSMKGRGFALFQLDVFYNVDSGGLAWQRSHSGHGEAFDLDVVVSDDDLDHLSLTVCTKLREDQLIVQTGMALVEVGMLSGLRLAEGGLRTDRVVRKVETPPGKVVLYLDSVTTLRVCIQIPTVRDFKVAGVQEAMVVVYDYYEPRRRTERMYNSEVMRRTSLCSFCGDDCNSCGGKPIISSASITSSPYHHIRSLACALVILATFIH